MPDETERAPGISLWSRIALAIGLIWCALSTLGFFALRHEVRELRSDLDAASEFCITMFDEELSSRELDSQFLSDLAQRVSDLEAR